MTNKEQRERWREFYEQRFGDFQDWELETLDVSLETWEYQQKKIDVLSEACELKDELLISYRLGKRPSEKLFNKIDKNKKALQKIKELEEVM